MSNQHREQDLDLLVRISEMYYVQGINQREISEKLGLSRTAVSRLLQVAKDQGIVSISVHNPVQELNDLASALMGHFGLVDCRVTPSESEQDALLARLAYQGILVLSSILKSGDVIGLGLSTAVHKIAELMPNTSEYACLKVVPISGGIGVAQGPQINYTVQLMANKLRADYVCLNAPLFIDEPLIAAKLMEETSIRECTALWEELACALVGIGVVPQQAQGSSFETKPIAALCGWFFSEQGESVDGKSTTSISIKQLKDTPNVVAVAGGRHKAAAILSALRTGLLTHLVTDEEVARAILYLVGNKS